MHHRSDSNILRILLTANIIISSIIMKILDRGYWVSQHFYWQSLYYYFLNGARFRCMTFFSVCNPAIDLGGMFDDRKTDVYELLPQNIVPATTIISSVISANSFIENNNLSFPLIIKPNIGLKGFMVYKLNSKEELHAFFEKNDVNEREWLLQEYIDYKKEYSVLFYRYPKRKKFGISSFIEKSYPTVKGDGSSTLKTLIDKYNNPFLDKEDVYNRHSKKLDQVPEKGKKIILDYIGNYSRGAKFHDKMEFVTDEMSEMLSRQFFNVEGLNFFRIDFKANSVDDFLNGDFKVIEINGMKSEPLHIYDTRNTFVENLKTIKTHWNIIEDIAVDQKELLSGIPGLGVALKSLMTIKKTTR